MYNLQNQDNEGKYQKLAQAAGFRPIFKMLKVQERSGAVVMTQPVKKCGRQRGTQLHQLEHTDSQEAARSAPDHSRTKAAEWQGAQGKGRRLCSGSTPGMWAAVVGTCSWGQLRGVSPRPRQGVRDALGTIQSITGDNSDNEGTQQHSVVANSWQWPLHCKSVCIIISWVCMLESCHIWFPEKGLSLYFSSFLWRRRSKN